MGMEYRLEVSQDAPKTLDQVLRAAPHFARYEEQFKNYEYRTLLNLNVDKMPDAVAAIEEWGYLLVRPW